MKSSIGALLREQGMSAAAWLIGGLLLYAMHSAVPGLFLLWYLGIGMWAIEFGLFRYGPIPMFLVLLLPAIFRRQIIHLMMYLLSLGATFALVMGLVYTWRFVRVYRRGLEAQPSPAVGLLIRLSDLRRGEERKWVHAALTILLIDLFGVISLYWMSFLAARTASHVALWAGVAYWLFTGLSVVDALGFGFICGRHLKSSLHHRPTIMMFLIMLIVVVLCHLLYRLAAWEGVAWVHARLPLLPWAKSELGTTGELIRRLSLS